MEIGKTVFQNDDQRMWCEFLRTGCAPPGAPAYLVEAATMVDYMNLLPEERAVIDLAEKEKAILSAERSWELRHALAEGRAEGTRRVIRAALDQGHSVEEVAEFLGLPLQQVAEQVER